MFIAQKLRKENITEYLLYMWQIEDLIRAFNLDIELINKQIIEPYPVSVDEKKTLYEWYESLIDMMRMEHVQKEGHLQINKNTIVQLDELHGLLLKSGIDAAYSAKFYHILPLISQLRNQQENPHLSDIEICFNFQYAIMILRMKKTEITSETQKAQAETAKYLILLAKNYTKYQNGDLRFDED
ncbi:conserved hypothetical protein [uncultured Paludibacter sp.]|uniref:DUF4924 domain-containing protein n=1 Tax=uncultured Paludibacter sp. TaxID=497635 RepID=A0A653ACI9_9BACT|nr:conserved hypothetical protein [uncultured Paludibacter sp.]